MDRNGKIIINSDILGMMQRVYELKLFWKLELQPRKCDKCKGLEFTWLNVMEMLKKKCVKNVIQGHYMNGK